jgi:glycosyltransferase involved in cell wall biosynthesis
MLCAALAERCDLLVVSFRRQYPMWLFPGESDRDPRQRPFSAAEVRYLIDAVNPLTWRKAVAAISDHTADLVIIPWWTAYWAPCFGWIARACRRRGLEVRFLCHNVVEHETAAWRRLLADIVLRQATSFIAHTREDARRLRRLFPAARIDVQPTPIFNQFPAPAAPAARQSGGLRLLFFGLVRPYKGLDTLMEAMGRLKGRDVSLTVVGEFWHGRKEIEALIGKLGIGDSVTVVPRYVSDEEAASYFAATDAVVLPYRTAASTGVIPLAYHYDKPVIVTNVGGLPDAVVEGETGYIVPPEQPAVLAEIISALTPERAASMVPAIRRLKATMTWEGLAATVLGQS